MEYYPYIGVSPHDIQEAIKRLNFYLSDIRKKKSVSSDSIHIINGLFNLLYEGENNYSQTAFIRECFITELSDIIRNQLAIFQSALKEMHLIPPNGLDVKQAIFCTGITQALYLVKNLTGLNQLLNGIYPNTVRMIDTAVNEESYKYHIESQGKDFILEFGKNISRYSELKKIIQILIPSNDIQSSSRGDSDKIIKLLVEIIPEYSSLIVTISGQIELSEKLYKLNLKLLYFSIGTANFSVCGERPEWNEKLIKESLKLLRGELRSIKDRDIAWNAIVIDSDLNRISKKFKSFFTKYTDYSAVSVRISGITSQLESVLKECTEKYKERFIEVKTSFELAISTLNERDEIREKYQRGLQELHVDPFNEFLAVRSREANIQAVMNRLCSLTAYYQQFFSSIHQRDLLEQSTQRRLILQDELKAREFYIDTNKLNLDELTQRTILSEDEKKERKGIAEQLVIETAPKVNPSTKEPLPSERHTEEPRLGDTPRTHGVIKFGSGVIEFVKSTAQSTSNKLKKKQDQKSVSAKSTSDSDERLEQSQTISGSFSQERVLLTPDLSKQLPIEDRANVPRAQSTSRMPQTQSRAEYPEQQTKELDTGLDEKNRILEQEAKKVARLKQEESDLKRSFKNQIFIQCNEWDQNWKPFNNKKSSLFENELYKSFKEKHKIVENAKLSLREDSTIASFTQLNKVMEDLNQEQTIAIENYRMSIEQLGAIQNLIKNNHSILLNLQNEFNALLSQYQSSCKDLNIAPQKFKKANLFTLPNLSNEKCLRLSFQKHERLNLEIETKTKNIQNEVTRITDLLRRTHESNVEQKHESESNLVLVCDSKKKPDATALSLNKACDQERESQLELSVDKVCAPKVNTEDMGQSVAIQRKSKAELIFEMQNIFKNKLCPYLNEYVDQSRLDSFYKNPGEKPSASGGQLDLFNAIKKYHKAELYFPNRNGFARHSALSSRSLNELEAMEQKLKKDYETLKKLPKRNNPGLFSRIKFFIKHGKSYDKVVDELSKEIIPVHDFFYRNPYGRTGNELGHKKNNFDQSKFDEIYNFYKSIAAAHDIPFGYESSGRYFIHSLFIPWNLSRAEVGALRTDIRNLIDLQNSFDEVKKKNKNPSLLELSGNHTDLSKKEATQLPQQDAARIRRLLKSKEKARAIVAENLEVSRATPLNETSSTTSDARQFISHSQNRFSFFRQQECKSVTKPEVGRHVSKK